MNAVAELIAGVARRHVPSIARSITFLESRRPGYGTLADELWERGGHARIIGITGAPGSGKSTLTNSLVKELRARGRSVGVLAVDPSSSISGGSILGDRIRMADLTADLGVYVRSLSTRGSLGGLSKATVDAASVLDAAGFDDVVIETVGVGQAEVDIVEIAHVVLVVSVPGMGDEIQMIKAGLIELADIHVVNKADRPEAHRTVAEIRSMLALAASMNPRQRRIDIVETSAVNGTGTRELVDAIDRFMDALRTSASLDETFRRAVVTRIREITKELMIAEIEDRRLDVRFGDVVDDVVERKMSPYSGARRLLASIRHVALSEVPS